MREEIRSCVGDVSLFLSKMFKDPSKKRILIEGANATMLDIDFGNIQGYTKKKHDCLRFMFSSFFC